MQMDVSGTVGQAVAAYTGAVVLELECQPDPVHRGVFAFQALVKYGSENPYIVQFLVREGSIALQNIRSEHLSEVEFTQWPPVTRQ